MRSLFALLFALVTFGSVDIFAKDSDTVFTAFRNSELGLVIYEKEKSGDLFVARLDSSHKIYPLQRQLLSSGEWTFNLDRETFVLTKAGDGYLILETSRGSAHIFGNDKWLSFRRKAYTTHYTRNVRIYKQSRNLISFVQSCNEALE